MPTLTALLLTALCLLAPVRAEANPLCRWLSLCFYMSPEFELTVVDAETNKPLAGVYAWAEWVQFAAHGLNGPLMVVQAVSGVDGRLVFPRWGPRLGSGAGMNPGYDPALLVYKPAYSVLIVTNAGEASFENRTSVYRPLTQSGETIRLQKFSGGVNARVKQLEELAISPYIGRMSEQQGGQFRVEYLQRLDLVETELLKLPQGLEEVSRFRSSLRRDRKFWTGEAR